MKIACFVNLFCSTQASRLHREPPFLSPAPKDGGEERECGAHTSIFAGTSAISNG